MKKKEIVKPDISWLTTIKAEPCVMITKSYCDELERKAEAFDLIKEKDIDVIAIKVSADLEEYNENKSWEADEITQEQFDLLKEVLK